MIHIHIIEREKRVCGDVLIEIHHREKSSRKAYQFLRKFYLARLSRWENVNSLRIGQKRIWKLQKLIDTELEVKIYDEQQK